MFDLKPRFVLSPRFLALPLFALAVIVGLSQFGREAPAGGTMMVSGPALKAVNCSNPTPKNEGACALARETTGRRTVQ